MAFYKYGFVLQSRSNPTSVAELPDPSGSLSKSIPSSAIKAANTAVRDALIEKEALKAKRGRYQHYSDKERAEIAKRATEFGITATIRHYMHHCIQQGARYRSVVLLRGKRNISRS